jgi:hypothetical protein
MEHPATAPPAKQEGKRPRDDDLLGYLTPTGCSTTRRRLRKHWLLASFALHRWLDSLPHGQARRPQAEVARPGALLRLRIS